MSRHATTLAPDPSPTAPVRIDIAWPSLVARGDLGSSTNALAESPTEQGISADHGSPLRRLRLVASVSGVADRDDHVLFTAAVEEDGSRSPIGPRGVVPGTIAMVGDHLHVTVDDPTGRDGDPILTAVLDAAGTPLMIRQRLAAVAGLRPGAAGRPTVSVSDASTTPDAPYARVDSG